MSLHPLVEESATSMLKLARADKDLRVAGPAEAFVALRAVGGDFEEVALLAPDDVVLELLEQGMRAGEEPVGFVSECRTMPVTSRIFSLAEPAIEMWQKAVKSEA